MGKIVLKESQQFPAGQENDCDGQIGKYRNRNPCFGYIAGWEIAVGRSDHDGYRMKGQERMVRNAGYCRKDNDRRRYHVSAENYHTWYYNGEGYGVAAQDHMQHTDHDHNHQVADRKFRREDPLEHAKNLICGAAGFHDAANGEGGS